MVMDAPIPTRIDALLTLAHWLSPSFPIGAFAYSHGLESAVAQGWVSGSNDFRDWLDDVLRFGAGRNDAILLAASYRGAPEAEALARAIALSRERRLETEAQGAAFAATSGAIWGTPVTPAPLPVAVGRAAAAIGLPLEDTSALYLHAFAANLTSAAIRLIPLGQTEAHGELARLTPLCRTLAQETLDLTLDDLGGCAFVSDVCAMRHESLEPRLFRS